MGDGSGDLQKIWHVYVGKHIVSGSVLDVGAGLGKSKGRLLIGADEVVTQDIDRARMLDVDVICPLEEITEIFDYVTAFDVIEHVPHPVSFLTHMWKRSRKGIFVTTPNAVVYPHPWHFTPAKFALLLSGFVRDRQEAERVVFAYFCRCKTEQEDIIIESTWSDFLRADSPIVGLGVLVQRRENA